MSNKKQESLSKWFTKGNRNKQKTIKEIETNKVSIKIGQDYEKFIDNSNKVREFKVCKKYFGNITRAFLSKAAIQRSLDAAYFFNSVVTCN